MTDAPAMERPPRIDPVDDVRPAYLRDDRIARLRAAAAQPRRNWMLYAFVLLIPLQNVYAQYIPNIGGGINFLNVMFVLSLVGAWRCGGRLVAGTGVNGWVFAYIAAACVALLVGYAHLSDPQGHANTLKDQLIAVAFVFLAQWSARDWDELRRLLLVSLLPLPYMLYVVLDQHTAVSAWHYNHALRVSGTFAELGANELAAFCTTATLLTAGLLLASRLRWHWKALLTIAGACAATGLVLAYSRTAYVAVLAGIAAILLLRHERARLVPFVAAAALVLPAILPPSVHERFHSIELAEGSRDESTDNRFRYWEIALERYSQAPLLGVGFHAFHHPEVNPHGTDTHNFFLRELVEKGTLGALVLLGLLYSIARLLWRTFRRSEPGSWEYGVTLGMLGAMLALVCANCFGDRFTHYPMIAHFWLYVGIALRAAALQAARRSDPRSDMGAHAAKPLARRANALGTTPSPRTPPRTDVRACGATASTPTCRSPDP